MEQKQTALLQLEGWPRGRAPPGPFPQCRPAPLEPTSPSARRSTRTWAGKGLWDPCQLFAPHGTAGALPGQRPGSATRGPGRSVTGSRGLSPVLRADSMPPACRPLPRRRFASARGSSWKGRPSRGVHVLPDACAGPVVRARRVSASNCAACPAAVPGSAGFAPVIRAAGAVFRAGLPRPGFPAGGAFAAPGPCHAGPNASETGALAAERTPCRLPGLRAPFREPPSGSSRRPGRSTALPLTATAPWGHTERGRHAMTALRPAQK